PIGRHADCVGTKETGGKWCAPGGTVNNVASFLPNLPARSSAVSQWPRGDSEAVKNSQGDGDGFEAVLSGLSTPSPSGKQAANAAASAPSPGIQGGSSRSLNALLPMTQGSSAGGS